jgi:hypothetical protein
MKPLYLMLLLGGISLTACDCKNTDSKSNFKYKLGEVVYIKPDSLKSTIVGRYDINGDLKYDVKFYTKNGEEVNSYVHQYEIYSSY